jgi:hypothetical protein
MASVHIFIMLIICLAASANVGPPAVSCTNNLNCSLNGVCDLATKQCVCDAPWFNDRVNWQCGSIFTAKAKPGGMYGYSPNVTSWVREISVLQSSTVYVVIYAVFFFQRVGTR